VVLRAFWPFWSTNWVVLSTLCVYTFFSTVSRWNFATANPFPKVMEKILVTFANSLVIGWFAAWFHDSYIVVGNVLAMVLQRLKEGLESKK
jgi:hypothetical protein